jgi:hypothetical protein
MRFAKYVFIGAGIWGVAVLTPFYWLVDLSGRHYNAPIDYPQFFYGFFSVAMAWQIAFFVIGFDPARFRPMMIPGIIEKLGHTATVLTLYSRGRVSVADAQAALPDLVLAAAFIAAWLATGRAAASSERARGRHS